MSRSFFSKIKIERIGRKLHSTLLAPVALIQKRGLVRGSESIFNIEPLRRSVVELTLMVRAIGGDQLKLIGVCGHRGQEAARRWEDLGLSKFLKEREISC